MDMPVGPGPLYWFIERHREDTGLFMGARRVWTYRSNFQDIAVLETETWGRVLVLDGLVQMTDRDEFIYHEMLAHVPLMTHPDPRRVLIIGGGDGGVLREVLRHPEVTRVVLCEIDPMVIEVVRRHWPEHGAIFDDPRVQVLNEDGSQLVQATHERYDVLIVDSSDPVSYSRSLFSPHFLAAVRRVVYPSGLYATQCMSLLYHLDFVKGFYRQLQEVFSNVALYTAPVPSYPTGWWNFAMASIELPLDPESLSFKERPIEFLRLTRYYNLEIHRSAFTLPNFWVQELQYAHGTDR
jgi:spermidine synthase